MNKYKVIYYVVVIALLVSVFLLIGMDLSWFNPYQSDQFVWVYFALIPVIEWIEKKSKNLASEKRRMNMKKKRRLLFLMSIVFGGVLGMFVGMFKARVESHEIILDVKALMPWISAICLLIGFISMFLTFNFLKKSRKFHSLYQEEMDDDLNETYYVQMYRNLEFGTIAFNITGVAIPLAIFISLSEVIILHTNPQTFFLSFLLFVVFLVAQKSLFKTIAIVRQFDLEFFATPKDVLNYINSYDEGERQANLEQSFRILFQLHQYVLPALYIFLIIISFLTGEIQLLAFLLVGAIHVYINVMQLPMVKRYFK